MKEFKLNNETVIKYKNTLSEAQYITLIEVTIDAYQNGIDDMTDNIGLSSYNPIKAEQAFNRMLLNMIVDEYDANNYELYFESGLHIMARNDVINAHEAWDAIQQLMNNSLNVSNVINNFLTKIVNVLNDKLPEGDKMVKVLNKLPKEWTKVFDEFQSITGQETKINEEQK